MEEIEIEGLIPTALTWEEKNPINYIYRPCEAMFRLEKRLKLLENPIQSVRRKEMLLWTKQIEKGLELSKLI